MLLHNWLLQRPITIGLCLLMIGAALSGGGLSLAQDPLTNPPQKIESDDERVVRIGTWAVQSATAASGGSYLYNSGEAALALNFAGPSLEVIYVAGPSLDTLAIEVDGTVLRTVITTGENTAYGQVAKIDYLTDELHELKVYAQGGGVVAIDAFSVMRIIDNGPVLSQNYMESTELIDFNNLPPDPRFPLCNPTNDLIMVSRTATGEVSPTLEAISPLFSADGRYMTYIMKLPGTPSLSDIFRYDRTTCTSTHLVRQWMIGFGGVAGQVYQDLPIYDFSANGRYLTFLTRESLVPEDNTVCYTHPLINQPAEPIPCKDIYRLDIQTGEIRLISPPNGAFHSMTTTGQHKISADGSTLFWWVYVTYLDVGPTYHQFASTALSYFRVASNGRYLATESRSSGIVPDDTNTYQDAFLFDIPAGDVVRVSVATDGTQGNGDSRMPLPSDDGQIVAFFSDASNLTTGDTNGVEDVFVRDIQASTTTRVSIASDGTQANGASAVASISLDGRYVTFSSVATNLIPNDTNGMVDYFVHDRQTHTTTRLFDNTLGLTGQPTPDHLAIAFISNQNGLVPDDTNEQSDIFLQIIGAVPDRLALWNSGTGQVGLLNSQHTPPPTLNITTFSPGPPSTGQLVMGDWDGDGDKTPGIYGNSGAFYYTNENMEFAAWSAVWVGLLNRPPVAGHFNAAVNHDCIGAVDSANFPPYGTAFALYFTCDLTNGTAPALTFQWISVLLPDSGGFSGTHQFSAGDFDNNGLDSVAVRRGTFIAFTNVPPSTLLAEFNLAQYWGVPPVTGDYGGFLTGDFDNMAGDSFGVFYQNGYFYYRNSVAWNPAGYILQSVGQPIGTPVQATTWR